MLVGLVVGLRNDGRVTGHGDDAKVEGISTASSL